MNARNTLRPCPCGETPDSIGVMENGQGGKYMLAVPDCCSEWVIEFNTGYDSGDALKARAAKAWNQATRGWAPIEQN